MRWDCACQNLGTTERPVLLHKVKAGESGRELVHRNNERLLGRAKTAVQCVHCVKTLVKGGVTSQE